MPGSVPVSSARHLSFAEGVIDEDCMRTNEPRYDRSECTSAGLAHTAAPPGRQQPSIAGDAQELRSSPEDFELVDPSGSPE